MSRFWELLVGGLLAVSGFPDRTGQAGGIIRWLPEAGVLLILCSVVWFDSTTPHPSFITLIPVAGAALIIGYSSDQGWLGRILACKPFVWVGLVSYSAYLWHFPIMAFSRTIDPLPSIEVKIGWIILTFVLSALSYRFIEMPFRRRDRFGAGRVTLVLSCLLACILAQSSYVLFTDGIKNRPHVQYAARSNFDDRYLNLERYRKCHMLEGKDAIGKDQFCTWGNNEKNVYLVGDSHMGALAFSLFEKFSLMQRNLVLMTRGGALFGRKPEVDKIRIAILEKARNETVIFGGYAHRENKDFFLKARDKYDNLIRTLIKNGNRIVFIYPIPPTELNRRGLVVENFLHGKLEDKKSSHANFRQSSRMAYEFYDSFNEGGIIRIYPEDYLCQKDDCFAVRNGEILISDYDHPSSITADWISEKIVTALEDRGN